ncbi:UNVERIFIED_CONTAM: Retrovirus-related Pol polyprotein from transposon RE2 [Sesamum latifolium]|uniref:Retrovirus-related Pol polyprotein from transposon RE2 n=1 Tax=Sesamum latifolium TaxID=2727402 RepID=A0AAW2WE31_9LAMI
MSPFLKILLLLTKLFSSHSYFLSSLPVPALSIPPHTEKPTRPLQVYSRRLVQPLPRPDPPDPPPAAAPGTPATSANDLPSLFAKALRHPAWKLAMDDEMSLSFRGVHGSLWSHLLTLMLLLADGYLLSNFGLTGPSIVNLNWPMYQMDIKNAFLYGDLNENCLHGATPGYVAQGEKQRLVCKLKKAIYGLKQSPRAWFINSVALVILGFRGAKQIIQSLSKLQDQIWGGQGIWELKSLIASMGSLSQRKYACDLLQEAGMLGGFILIAIQNSRRVYYALRQQFGEYSHGAFRGCYNFSSPAWKARRKGGLAKALDSLAARGPGNQESSLMKDLPQPEDRRAKASLTDDKGRL